MFNLIPTYRIWIEVKHLDDAFSSIATRFDSKTINNNRWTSPRLQNPSNSIRTPAHLLRPLDISANVSKVVTPEESKGGARVWIGRTCVNSQWSVHRLARNAGVGYKLRPLLSPHQAPATLPPLAENARLLCMKWLWRVWCEVARPRATSRSSLRLARWQLQNVPAAPSPSAKRRLYPRQRGCSPLFSRRKISRVSRGMIDRRCISIVRFCIVVLLEISRCANWVLLFFILLSLWTRLICDIQARCSFRNT